MNNSELNIDQEKYPLVPSDPEIIPESTYWPIFLAFGITFFMWGYLLTLYVSIMGLICMIVALIGWINELNKEK
jgi:hypothetical protein